ncbi:MAG: 30S ribosomal protein S18 [Solirubrobacteraceae bacterium]|nr:30S ribosomal protein S18 [Solirubrobacteraceae bacterium]
MAKQRNSKPGKRRDKKLGGGGRRKPCPFCKDKIVDIDYKDTTTLQRFVSERGKIRTRRITGCCRKHQRDVAIAVKRSRELSLLPYVVETVRETRAGRAERSGGGGGGDRGGDRGERQPAAAAAGADAGESKE